MSSSLKKLKGMIVFSMQKIGKFEQDINVIPNNEVYSLIFWLSSYWYFPVYEFQFKKS